MSVYDRATRKATAYGQERSFELIGMQLDIITNKILANDKIVKLLINTKKEALADKTPLTQEDRLSVIKDKYITLVPYLPKEEEIKSYLIIGFDDFTPTAGTDKAMDYTLSIDVLCHRDLWMMSGLCPRPYLIMNELKKEFHMAKLDTWGPAVFVGAPSLVANDSYMGFSMLFSMSALEATAPVQEDVE